jgi:hypothetical protein
MDIKMFYQPSINIQTLHLSKTQLSWSHFILNSAVSEIKASKQDVFSLSIKIQ